MMITFKIEHMSETFKIQNFAESLERLINRNKK